LLEAREKRGIADVHFLRLEQLYPFPADALAAELEPYKHCDLVWCQEEPRNMGAWAFANGFIEEVAEEVGCKNPRPRYAGRPSAASPATGSNQRHRTEQAELIDDALTLGKAALSRIAARKAETKGRAEDRAAPAAAK
jgi:2-oxoglutarate dehydrogenase E1 component